MPDLVSTSDITHRIADFIAGYRSAAGDPSAMMMAVDRAFPGSTASHFAVALTRANRASLGARDD